MGINYHGRVFRAVTNSDNGEVNSETRFTYYQEGKVLTGHYEGGAIAQGHILGQVSEDGSLQFLYHHLLENGELQCGQCQSIPKFTPKGQLQLHETWQWLSGDLSQGNSVIEEVIDPE